MNITSNAGCPVNSPSETSLPFVSGNRKSGAVVPNGSMVDGVFAMRKLCEERAEKSRERIKEAKKERLLELRNEPANHGSNKLRELRLGHEIIRSCVNGRLPMVIQTQA